MAEPAFIIGEFYKVPCVEWMYFGRKDWWPVIGPRHNDERIIGFAYDHYHVDYRFLNRSQRAFLDMPLTYARPHAVFTSPLAPMRFSEVPVEAPSAVPTLKRRKCSGEYPVYPHKDAPWKRKLEEAYECASMKAGVCPHQGVSLSGLQIVDGVVTCPLHGLRWKVDTGALVRTTVTPPPEPKQLTFSDFIGATA